MGENGHGWVFFAEAGELQYISRTAYLSTPGWEYRFSAMGDDGKVWDIVATEDLREMRYTKI